MFAETFKAPPRATPFEFESDQFPYGWRRVCERLLSGEVRYREIPLIPEDFLDPQLEDVMPQNTEHLQCSVDLYNIFHTRYLDEPTIGVFADLKMRWGIAGLLEPAPDIAVVMNLKNKTKSRSSFSVRKEGTRPSLVIEVMSPYYPGDDTEKVTIYKRAGVTEYLIINPYTKELTIDYTLSGYRLRGGVYQPITPDAQGRLFSQTTQVLIGVTDHGQRIRLKDAITGEWLLTAAETEKARQQEQDARIAEARRRVKAETLVAVEVQARRAAEVRAQVEAQARQTEAQARQAAEARAQALEKRLRELEARLK